MGENMSKKAPLSQEILEENSEDDKKEYIVDNDNISDLSDFRNLKNDIFICKKDDKDRIAPTYYDYKNTENIGYYVDILNGKTLDEIFSKKNYYKIIKTNFEKAFSGKKIDFEIKTENKFYKIYIQPFKKESNDYYSEVLCFFEDITKQKKINEEIKKRDMQFNNLIEKSPYSIQLIDSKGKTLKINNAWKELLGLKLNDLNGYNIFWDKQLIEKGFIPYLKRTFKGETVLIPPFEYSAKKTFGKGTTRWLSVTAYPTKNQRGEVSEVTLLYKDITKNKKTEEKLESEHKKLISIFDSIDEVIYVSDINTHEILYMNNPTIKNFGDNIGEKCYKIFHNRNNPCPFCSNKILLERKEHTHVTQNDINNRWYRCIDRLIPWPDGRDVRFELAIDITDLKKTEEKIIESETRYKELFENIGSCVAVYKAVDDGKDFEILDINNSSEITDKVKREDVIGKKVTSVFPGVTEFGLLDVFKRVYKTGESEICPTKFYKDHRISGWRKNYIYKLPSGEIVSVFEDVTKQKNYEEKIKKYQENLEKMVEERTNEVERAHLESERSKKNLQNIIDNASEIIISFDKTNRIITLSKRIENITGFSRKKIIGKHIRKAKIFENSDELIENIDRIKEDKPPSTNIITLNKNNDSRIIIKASFSPIKKDKSYDGMILIGEDITHQTESHGRLINGFCYYSLNGKNGKMFDYFKNILEIQNKKGLYITRFKPGFIQGDYESRRISTMILKQKSLKEIIEKTKDFVQINKNSVVLIDRVDYLISYFTFNDFLKFLYKITELISDNKAIFLLSINPNLFDKRELSFIKSELTPIPYQKLENIQIKDNYYDILELVNKYNNNNLLVEFKKISDALKINRKTLSKRIKQLEREGLIVVRRSGRSKTPYLTDKAKTILENKSIK